MLDKVIKTIEDFAMIPYGSDILIGLSGGADSTALLSVLLSVREKYGITVRCIHVNHNIRGDEAERDMFFCQNLCKKLGVPLICENVDIPELSKQTGQSTELCARDVRYRLFSKHCVDLIATAHNSNDNAETVLMNISRGTGIKGLCGIPPVRDNIIRPLIYCKRSEIENYLNSIGQDFVNDSTNNSNDYTRNKIRHNLLPEFEKINPNFSDTVSRATVSLRQDSDYLDKIAFEKFSKLFDGTSLSVDAASLDDAVRKRVLILFFNQFFNYYADLDYCHINEIDKVLLSKIRSTQLKHNRYCHLKNGRLCIYDGNIPEFSYDFSLENGCEMVKSVKVTSDLIKNSNFGQKINSLLFKNLIDCDKIVGKVSIRTRLDGDKYRPVSRNCTKTVKKLISDARLTDEQKNSIVIVSDEVGIVWVSRFGIDERVMVDNFTEKYTLLEYVGDNDE